MQIIGSRYEIEAELGAGGMGTVYRGRDGKTGETVAIKKLSPQLNNPELIERFRREGEALRDLKHPNIVQLLDMIHEADEHYLVMEYVTGGDMSKRLERGALPLNEILRLGIDLCDALTRAHKLDIIHRDLKPANILIAEDGTVRLSDFGVAHFGGKQRVTQTDSIIGTIDYLAPETFESSDIDKRADIWAVGVILFEMLTGNRPFSGSSITQTLNQIVSGKIPDIEELCPTAPPALVDLIYRILTRNPDERIPSIRLVGADLEALLNNSPTTSATVKLVHDQNIASNFLTTPVATHRHNLPRPNTPFVGREAELHDLLTLLRDSQVQLVTIIAQGGMGKTRLSIEVGKALLEQYTDGVYFVELAPLTTAEDIPSAIAEVLGYPFNSGSSPQAQMVAYFRDKTCLLILDNFEHMLAGRDLVQAIIQDSPQSKILVSSRERLNLSSEILYHLEGMDFPEWETPADASQYTAIRLFKESAKRVRPDFALEATDLPFAVRICRLVHGLPLGIVLAASWLDVLSLKEIGEEIASNVDFLESTMHDLPERQRSIRAVFDYSWKMLSDDEQQSFARLSVFRGGMTREAAQAVSETNLRSLQTLVNKSLLRRNNSTGRFEIHELLRQYGEEFLHQQGLFDETCLKHATYYAEWLVQQDKVIKGQRQVAGLSELDTEFENVKSAWHFACQNQDATAIGKMLEAIYWYCTFRNRNMEGQELFQKARHIWGDDSLLAGRLLVRYPPTVRDYTATYERGLAIAQHHQDQFEIAFALRQLGHWLSHTLEKPEGITRMEESSDIFEQLDEKFYLAIVLDDLGWSYRSSGLLDLQLDVVQQSIDLRREIGDKIGMSNALRNMGGALGGMGSGNIEPLYKWLEALELSIEIGDKRNIAWNNYMLSIFWQYEGELEKALPYRQQAEAVANEIKEEIVLRLCLLSDALDLILTTENAEKAKAMLAEGYPPNSLNDFRVVVYTTVLSFVAVIENDYASTKEIALRMYALGYDRGHPMVAMTVFLASLFLVREEKYELAMEWLAMGEQTPLYRMGKVWVWYQRFRADLVARMSPQTYEAVYARGSKRDMIEVATEAAEYLRKQAV